MGPNGRSVGRSDGRTVGRTVERSDGRSDGTVCFLFIFGVTHPLFSILHVDEESKFVEEKIKTLKENREKEAEILERKA